jgi:hypothetical protein
VLLPGFITTKNPKKILRHKETKKNKLGKRYRKKKRRQRLFETSAQQTTSKQSNKKCRI